MDDKPLGLNAGSVRSIIALALVFTGIFVFISLTIYGMYKGYSFQLSEILKDLILMIGIILAFYFGMRANKGVIEKLPKEEIVEVIKEVVDDNCMGEE